MWWRGTWNGVCRRFTRDVKGYFIMMRSTRISGLVFTTYFAVVSLAFPSALLNLSLTQATSPWPVGHH